MNDRRGVWKPRLLGVALGALLISGGGSAVRADPPREVELREVAAPTFPRPGARPHLPEVDRAIHDVAPALTSLLAISPTSLATADPEFIGYYTETLLPMIERPWTALTPDDVLQVDLDRDGVQEVVLVGAWRDTFFLHDLWFVAVLARQNDGVQRLIMFQRLGAAVRASGLVDMDGDGQDEVVVIHGLSIGCGAPWHLTVIAMPSGAVSSISLPSEHRPSLVRDGATTPPFVRTATSANRWSPAGFTLTDKR